MLHVQVKRGHLVFDPFVGTGSILVAAAHFGAQTIGADIDIRVVRDGKSSICIAHTSCIKLFHSFLYLQ